MSAPVARPDLEASFRGAMRRLAATVTIVTAFDGSRRHGMTVTAVASVSVDPPSVLVCLNRSTLLHDIMLGARLFCVNVLHHDQAALSAAFSGKLPPEARFGFGDWRSTEDGVPFLADAQATLVCRRIAALPSGTHTIFVGDAFSAGHRDEVAPLIYENAAYCRTQPVLPRMTPEPASLGAWPRIGPQRGTPA